MSESNMQSMVTTNITGLSAGPKWLTKFFGEEPPPSSHHPILKLFRKMNEITNECNFLHWHGISFHLSHQPHLYVLHHFLLTNTVPWDQKIVHKSDVMRRDVVDGSNESLYHANEENYTHL